ncbi:MAG: hypothetical protein QOF37_1881 [Thermoleophilaceae bacterium]|nr:hypothetical protein [Thermoleophilaceae bacterium]
MTATTSPREERLPTQRSAGASRIAMLVGGVLGVVVLAILHLDRGRALWDFSEGVYALTSRVMLHGGDVYGHVVVAQPPGIFVFGAGALSVHDGIEWLRLCVGAWQLLAGVLCARIVWRLTGSRVATAITPAAALLMPWNLHEHGALTPELIAPPLVLGAALLAARPRPRAAGDGGALAALAVAVKLPYALPAVAIVLLAANRRRAVAWAGITLAVEALVAFVLFGDGLWRYIVVAQSHSGWQNAHDLLRVWAQEGWNLAGLVVAAAVALRFRHRLADPALVRVTAGLAVAMLLTLLTNLKHGTALNIVAPIELSLLPLAVAGVVAAAREGGLRRIAIPAAALALVTAQSISLLASPQPTAAPFLYPTSQPGTWQRGFSNAEVDTLERQAAACPPGIPFGGGLSYVAFLAHRAMPDGQPDTYLTRDSPTLKATAAAIDADKPTCP